MTITKTHHLRFSWLHVVVLAAMVFPMITDDCNGQQWSNVYVDQLSGLGEFEDVGSSYLQSEQAGEKVVQAEEPRSKFRLTEFNVYPTFSFLGEQIGNYTEFEFASETEVGRWEMENRTVLNVADLPGTIRVGPTNPGDEPTVQNVRNNGFGDVLSGFFFSRQKEEAQRFHLGLGPVITLPTASNGFLGSGQVTIGPGAHFNTEIGNRLTAGFFLWQSWGLTNDPTKKRVNQLFGKPFFIYEVSEKWNLIYIPLGLSYSWKSPQGDDWTVPIGGGVRRLFKIRDQKMGLQFQAFDYVARKPDDPEWELRFTIEFIFD